MVDQYEFGTIHEITNKIQDWTGLIFKAPKIEKFQA